MNDVAAIREHEAEQSAETVQTVRSRIRALRAAGVLAVSLGGIVVGLILGSIVALLLALVGLC